MRINTVLFGLTGFGNQVLKQLLKNKAVKVMSVFTRKEKAVFPYYSCEQIDSYAKKNNISVYYDNTFTNKDADLIIIATYHKLIELKKSNYTFAIKIQPSLLPKYKGRDPINEVLKKKEEFTGVSLHKLTEKFDSGEIIIQEKLKIDKNDDKSKIMKKMLNIYSNFTNYYIESLKKDLS